jgi:hypothetical protein
MYSFYEWTNTVATSPRHQSDSLAGLKATTLQDRNTDGIRWVITGPPNGAVVMSSSAADAAAFKSAA